MSATHRRDTIVVLVALLALCGCAEDGAYLNYCGDGTVNHPYEECDLGDQNGVPDSGCSINCETGSGPVLPPTLASIQETIFTPICTACHNNSGGEASFLPLVDEETSYAGLVDFPVSIYCGDRRVTPGFPDDSCLVHAIEGSEQFGGTNPRMPPLPTPPLEQAQIDQIRQWITDGALP